MNIILGGTHGLGREIAKELQAHGEETFVTGRTYTEAEHGKGMAVDLSDYGSVEELIGFIQGLGDVAIKRFFWVSGYGYVGDFAKQQNPKDMAEVNFSSVMPIAQIVWAKMLKSAEDSNFVVVSSTTGVKARKDEAVYAATKYAQVGFTKSLGMESERLGSHIKVALFMPGGMQTQFWDKDKPASYDDFLDPSKVAQKIVSTILAQGENFYEETIERGSL